MSDFHDPRVDLFAGLEPGPPFADRDALLLLDRSADEQGEISETLAGDRWIRNVSLPTLTPVLPDPSHATRAAVIVAPGGAFRALSIDNEGLAAAHWLAGQGIAAFLLKYRLVPTPRPTRAFLAEVAGLLSLRDEGGANAPDERAPPDAIADLAQAIDAVRAGAGQWAIEPDRVGVLGFSAGAIMAVELGARPGPSQPDFIAAVYPSLADFHPKPPVPPLFVVTTNDDPLFARRGFGLIDGWQMAEGSVELHCYRDGGHGFGMRPTGKASDRWIDALHDWLRMSGYC